MLVAKAFVELQQARHNADYNVEAKFSRDDVLTLIRTAERAFEAFSALDKKGAERCLFLAALAFSERWQKNWSTAIIGLGDVGLPLAVAFGKQHPVT